MAVCLERGETSSARCNELLLRAMEEFKLCVLKTFVPRDRHGHHTQLHQARRELANEWLLHDTAAEAFEMTLCRGVGHQTAHMLAGDDGAELSDKHYWMYSRIAILECVNYVVNRNCYQLSGGFCRYKMTK